MQTHLFLKKLRFSCLFKFNKLLALKFNYFLFESMCLFSIFASVALKIGNDTRNREQIDDIFKNVGEIVDFFEYIYWYNG